MKHLGKALYFLYVSHRIQSQIFDKLKELKFNIKLTTFPNTYSLANIFTRKREK